MRAWPYAAIFLAACHDGGLGSPYEGLAIEPAQLQFGSVAVGTSKRLELRVRNTGTPPRTLSLSAVAPFEVAVTELTLEAGASATVEVQFSPTLLGSTTGVLDGLGVVLTGEGAPRDCALLDCDDGNRCTLDSCENAQCLHGDIACPSSDACHAGRCDPAHGCVLEEVADGTRCGAWTCGWADVCIAGACERRPLPNAQRDCRYGSLVATGDLTCAATYGGDLRCWGTTAPVPGEINSPTPTFDALPPAHAIGPTRVPGFTQTVALGGSQGVVCAADELGAVKCSHAGWDPVSGLAPGTQKLVRSGRTAWLLTDAGSVLRWQLSALAPVDAGPVVDIGGLHGTFCGLDSVGRVSCVPGVTGVTRLETGPRGLYLLYDGGAAELASSATARSTLATSGAIAVGGTSSGDCVAFRGGVVRCGPQTVYLPAEVVSLTTGGNAHVCALTEPGDAWCWGANHRGQLGLPTSRPIGPRYLDAGFITGIRAGTYATIGDTLYGWGSTGWRPFADGGLAPPIRLHHTDLGKVPGRLSDPFFVDDAGVAYQFHPEIAAVRIGVLERWTGLGSYGCLRQTWLPDGTEALVGTPCEGFRSGDQGCTLSRDGGVSCFTNLWGVLPTYQPAMLGPVTWLSVRSFWNAGCAAVRAGGVRCFLPGQYARAIPGINTFVRAVTGTVYGGCALSGASTVQCWGDNYYGELGSEGRSSQSALTVPLNEPVAELSFSGYTHCVRFVSGRAACWGRNDEGNYAPLLEHSDAPIRVEQ